MQTTLKTQLFILFLALGFGCSSCRSVTGLKEAPEWVADFTDQLRCGMTLEEVSRATDRDLSPLTVFRFIPEPEGLEGYAIFSTWADVALYFREQKLVSYQRTFIDGFKSAQASPLVDLCTGELRYRIQLAFPSILDGSAVSLNGQDLEGSGIEVFVGVGKYEIRIEKNEYLPIVRELNLQNDRQARGSIYIRIEPEEIVPRGGQELSEP